MKIYYNPKLKVLPRILRQKGTLLEVLFWNKLNSFIAGIVLIVVFVLSGNVFSADNQRAEIQEPSKVAMDNCPGKKENDGVRKMNFLIDFSDYSGGSVYEWLKSKGFRFHKGAKNRKLIELSAHDGALVIKAKKRVRGFIFNESIDLKEFSTVRIEWGIIQYPKDASFERKINNEALMIYVFFGSERLSSGSFFIPDSPYFVGLFLSKDDEINKPYKGKYFHKGGRYVCIGSPEPQKAVISEFDLVSAFQTYFKDEAPVISGICLAFDTSSAGDGGKAAAFIKRIEFLNK